ncbi:cobalamin-independent synthase, N-terminal domain protein [Nocardiopsis alba ATCC BAA-2165]|uniref:Cobalamin-independent synthase, N-terminal domain protein n=1 Tax=Nocardiopsis alba (strain ATCC BAA-2165 / BE74) TaxID=1205910 RepID=J7LCG9_NOCAA|nr:cobalamin-independent synthase, N-terminal domain protein [Nocardiopsis alba ATCC BAA-2165]
MRSTVHGYPRIGPRRELKRAIESYWKGATTARELDDVAAGLRRDAYTRLREAGVDDIPSNTFSYYDHVLDTAVMFDLVPSRLPSPARAEERDERLRRYFALARGVQGAPPLEMTKWFDTNYHYLVPELSPNTRPRLVDDKPVAEFREALDAGFRTRPVLLGPLTFLLSAKVADDAPEGWEPIELLDQLLDAYVRLLADLAAAGATEVQLAGALLQAAGRGGGTSLPPGVHLLRFDRSGGATGAQGVPGGGGRPRPGHRRGGVRGPGGRLRSGLHTVGRGCR